MGSKKGSGKATSSGKMGGSSGGMQYTKGYLKRKKLKMQKEEEYWASMNGPVTISYKEPK
mgnify:CR=1 FL=1